MNVGGSVRELYFLCQKALVPDRDLAGTRGNPQGEMR
jgi:hypothetical protein